MANVEEVETSVCKNDPFPFGLYFLKDLPQLLFLFDLLILLHLCVLIQTYQIKLD
jgi:hypothetical protein